MPVGPKGKGTFAFTVSYSINAKTQQKDAAWFLVNYLTGQQGMQKWTSLGLAMPSRKSLATGLPSTCSVAVRSRTSSTI